MSLDEIAFALKSMVEEYNRGVKNLTTVQKERYDKKFCYRNLLACPPGDTLTFVKPMLHNLDELATVEDVKAVKITKPTLFQSQKLISCYEVSCTFCGYKAPSSPVNRSFTFYAELKSGADGLNRGQKIRVTGLCRMEYTISCFGEKMEVIPYCKSQYKAPFAISFEI